MIYRHEEITDRNGNTCVFRSLRQEDADELNSFVRQGSGESPFFPWAPGGTRLTADNAAEYILEFEKGERKMLLGAFRDGKLIGLTELSGMSEWVKMRHRCAVAAGILKEAQGSGLGKKLTLAVIDVARELGYEQVECTTATSNEVSAANLRSMGYEEYGMIPHKMKNEDGSYVDELKFVKWL